MSVNPFRPKDSVPPFINPLLETLDRFQHHDMLQPDQLTKRARTVLLDRIGGAQGSVEAAFAHGGTGLLGGHTHYFDGFAMILPLRQGTAVAVQEANVSASKVVFEGAEEQWGFDRNADASHAERGDWPSWVCIVEEVVRRLSPEGGQVEIAVVSTVPSGCTDAYLAALGLACARAVQALFALPDSTTDLLQQVRQLISDASGVPFSIAYPIAAEAGRPETFSLIDAGTHEHLPMEFPTQDAVGWGLLDVGSGLLHDPAVYWKRKERADKALALLQKDSFPQLTSLRDLEHRDLQQALSALPRRYRPFVRHLITENRRVQKLIVAARRRDWQMFGAMLLMSHASLRDDWQSMSDEVNFVVKEVEAMTLEGMYGACVTGRSGCVLVMGLPFVVPTCLDRIKGQFEARFKRTPEVILL